MAGTLPAARLRRLFHVEDSSDLRIRVEGELTRLGVEIAGFAARADDAVREIRRTKPDLVVLDLQLEEGSGVDVLRNLSSGAEHPTFIVLTNHSDARFRKLALQAGAQHFFDKSTQLDEFVELVRSIACPAQDIHLQDPAGVLRK